MKILEKIIIPITIIISVFIICSYLYIIEAKKQENYLTVKKREYIAQKKKDCYYFYENDKEALGFNYDEFNDKCILSYNLKYDKKIVDNACKNIKENILGVRSYTSLSSIRINCDSYIGKKEI